MTMHPMEIGMQTAKYRRLPTVRGVSPQAKRGRRYRFVLRRILDALPSEPTHAEQLIAESAAALQLQIESLRTRLVAGEVVSSDKLVKLTGALRRHLRDLAIGGDAP